jgi:hypothetical protein
MRPAAVRVGVSGARTASLWLLTAFQLRDTDREFPVLFLAQLALRNRVYARLVEEKKVAYKMQGSVCAGAFGKAGTFSMTFEFEPARVADVKRAIDEERGARPRGRIRRRGDRASSGCLDRLSPQGAQRKCKAGGKARRSGKTGKDAAL